MADYTATIAPHLKRAVKLVNQATMQVSKHTLWDCFVRMAVYAYSRQRYEQQYLECVEQVGADIARNVMPELLGIMVTIAEAMQQAIGWADPFGLLFEQLELQNTYNGQYFTPVGVTDLMAQLTVPGPAEQVITLNDPACGSGRTLLAGRKIAQTAVLLGTDVSHIACWMFTANLAMQGLAGEVACMNTLTREYRWHARVNWPAAVPYEQTGMYMAALWGVEIYTNEQKCYQY